MNLTKPYFTSVCNSALHSESGLVKGVTSWEWISMHKWIFLITCFWKYKWRYVQEKSLHHKKLYLHFQKSSYWVCEFSSMHFTNWRSILSDFLHKNTVFAFPESQIISNFFYFSFAWVCIYLKLNRNIHNAVLLSM